MSACLCDSTMSANYTALRGASLLELQQRANQNQLIELGKRTSGCTLENVIIRKEWQRTLSSNLASLYYYDYLVLTHI